MSWLGTKLKECFNKPSSPEEMRAKRIQQESALRIKAQESARKNAAFKKLAEESNGMVAAKPTVKVDAGKEHRREMHQDRVKGFSFTCGK